MSQSGFFIKWLRLTGPGVPVAEVEFTQGLNVIAGASDTGKTYIEECIDFVFGKGTVPRPIDKAKSYDTVEICLHSNASGEDLILHRPLAGDALRLKAPRVPDRTLGAKHDAKQKDNVSTFLLELSGFPAARIKTNQRGETRSFTFRDLSRLILIDEESVIKTDSPFLGGERIAVTGDMGVFRFLIGGVDDSAVIAKPDPKLQKAKTEGQAELLKSMIEKATVRLNEMEAGTSELELQAQLTRLAVSIQKVTDELLGQQELATTLETRRLRSWEAHKTVQSRLHVLEELQKRFLLLDGQYASDLRRLETISEVSFRLGQLPMERCPICGSNSEHHDATHRSSGFSSEEIARASDSEARKLRVLRADLEKTLSDTQEEVTGLQGQRARLARETAALDHELKTSLQPVIRQLLEKRQELQDKHSQIVRATDLNGRIEEMRALLKDLGETKKKDGRATAKSIVTVDLVEDFCLEVEGLLRSWEFPNLTRVTYSEEDHDLVVSGQRRGSHGKGVRAITHAAFTIALMKYCRARQKPHPGLVVIDSPLVVYSQPEPDEKTFPVDVKDNFYRTLAKDFMNEQIIILENDLPSEDLADKINLIKFSGSTTGRWGFIP